MVLVSWFILLQLKFVQVDKCVISASASARGGSMEMYLLLAQKSMHHTFGNHGKRWKPSKEKSTVDIAYIQTSDFQKHIQVHWWPIIN